MHSAEIAQVADKMATAAEEHEKEVEAPFASFGLMCVKPLVPRVSGIWSAKLT